MTTTAPATTTALKITQIGNSVGVILPSTLHFGTAAPEIMELVGGRCRVKLDGSTEWKDYEGGQSFSVPGNSGFDIEALDAVHYVCHFG